MVMVVDLICVYLLYTRFLSIISSVHVISTVDFILHIILTSVLWKYLFVVIIIIMLYVIHSLSYCTPRMVHTNDENYLTQKKNVCQTLYTINFDIIIIIIIIVSLLYWLYNYTSARTCHKLLMRKKT